MDKGVGKMRVLRIVTVSVLMTASLVTGVVVSESHGDQGQQVTADVWCC